MYAAAVWAPGLAADIWTQIERPQICMFSRLFRSKHTVPHDIIKAEVATPPMVVEALFHTICSIERMRDLPADRLTRRAFEASRQLSESGVSRSWYSEVTTWFGTQGVDMEKLPPFQYDSDSPFFRPSRSERNTVLRQDLW
ncbi:hypothetical protein GOP47_0020432 [Adiantum capillus-veneris]|uniref:Uncharacterized protein n=1 Tax=Adiantum capillus-veneris TaxID=13818 RepID=A0A9D4Z9K0_ADICA|nr:hypothetical protein GOP47_0020432 [Adiantum capillus-veneris]